MLSYPKHRGHAIHSRALEKDREEMFLRCSIAETKDIRDYRRTVWGVSLCGWDVVGDF
jgi:hypothetical protein